MRLSSVAAFVGEGLILPYYYLQAETLWQPILWSFAFMTVNAVRIVATVLERRPVILSEREDQLYRVAFSSVDKREFLRLASLARWDDCSPGEGLPVFRARQAKPLQADPRHNRLLGQPGGAAMVHAADAAGVPV